MANPLKKAAVYLGLADEEFEYEEPAPAPVPAPVQPRAERAPVVPLRKSVPSRQAVPEMNEILTVHPRQYKDAQTIAEAFRDGIPVVINLSQMNDGDARRLIDFASGLSQGLLGKIERVTNKVFLLSPAHIAISGDPAVPASDETSLFAQA